MILPEFLDDAAAAWREIDHEVARLGHGRVGLANRLDGSEEGWITRAALMLWQACDMPAARSQAIPEVDAATSEVMSGSSPIGRCWRVTSDPGRRSTRPKTSGLWKMRRSGPSGRLRRCRWLRSRPRAPIQALPGDDPGAGEVASVAAERVEQLKRLRALVVAARLPAAAYMVAREWDQLQFFGVGRTRREAYDQ